MLFEFIFLYVEGIKFLLKTTQLRNDYIILMAPIVNAYINIPIIIHINVYVVILNY